MLDSISETSLLDLQQPVCQTPQDAITVACMLDLTREFRGHPLAASGDQPIVALPLEYLLLGRLLVDISTCLSLAVILGGVSL